VIISLQRGDFLSELKRSVGLFSAVSYVLGVIIGAGIYVILGKAAAFSGNALWLSFLFAAFIAACTGLSYAELASTFPYDSAEYVYTERAFKDRRFSFGIAWLKLVTTLIATAAVSLGFGGYLSYLTGWNVVFCALLLMAVLTFFNLVGMKQALWFDSLMVILAVAGLLLVIGFGAPEIKGFDFYLDSPSGFSGIFTGAALIFFAFLGFENIGNIGEEVQNPKRTLPLALIISVIISTLLYILVAVVAVSVVPWSQLASSPSPLSDVMTALIGTKAGFIMAIMALAATGSTVIGLLIATSRMIYGLSEEHSMPRFLMKVGGKNKVPYVSVILVAIICSFFILWGDIASIAFLTDFGALFIFMIVNLCVIVFRYSHHHIPRGFRVPGSIGKFPIIPALGLASCATLLFSFSKKMFFVGMVIFLSGMLIYMIFGERRFGQHARQEFIARPAAPATEQTKGHVKPKRLKKRQKSKGK
jgi:APA family basic amino acid/polyamine antiporter